MNESLFLIPLKDLIKILEESKTNPDLLKNSPVNTPIKRVDDVMAARTPVLKYSKDE